MGTTDRTEFSSGTLKWLECTSVGHRKRYGQFMTPNLLRERLLDQCDLWPQMRVLDPGVGTGEFLKALLRREPEVKVFGWDIDPQVLKVARENVPEAILEQRNSLEPYSGEQFDLVIGNPPYFQMKASRELRMRFGQVISGRVNIFALFFQVGLDVLKNGGQLAYVVPPSMNAGAYFNKLRDYILSLCDLEFLKVYTDHHLFDNAQTPVQLLVLRRGATNTARFTYIVRSESNHFSRTIFSENPSKLASSFEGSRSLYSLGYEAVTGTIVWNQHKRSLRRVETPRTVPLIWAHNIGDKLQLLESHRRPQYIETERPVLTGPALVVNRIVGAVGSGELRCAMVPKGWQFVGENHVNVVREHGHFSTAASWTSLLQRLKAPEIPSRVRRLTGNTQISATELTHLIPI